MSRLRSKITQTPWTLRDEWVRVSSYLHAAARSFRSWRDRRLKHTTPSSTIAGRPALAVTTGVAAGAHASIISVISISEYHTAVEQVRHPRGRAPNDGRVSMVAGCGNDLM